MSPPPFPLLALGMLVQKTHSLGLLYQDGSTNRSAMLS